MADGNGIEDQGREIKYSGEFFYHMGSFGMWVFDLRFGQFFSEVTTVLSFEGTKLLSSVCLPTIPPRHIWNRVRMRVNLVEYLRCFREELNRGRAVGRCRFYRPTKCTDDKVGFADIIRDLIYCVDSFVVGRVWSMWLGGKAR